MGSIRLSKFFQFDGDGDRLGDESVEVCLLGGDGLFEFIHAGLMGKWVAETLRWRAVIAKCQVQLLANSTIEIRLLFSAAKTS